MVHSGPDSWNHEKGAATRPHPTADAVIQSSIGLWSNKDDEKNRPLEIYRSNRIADSIKYGVADGLEMELRGHMKVCNNFFTDTLLIV